MALEFRSAGPDDAEPVARLHADSWRRFYRGAFADEFLDGDVVADRRGVWSVRLAASASAPSAVVDRAATDAMHLWVLKQNTAAQGFYRALGGEHVETAKVSPPGGVPSRLNGSPDKFRMAWRDARSLAPVARS
jgi:hypothetical protein